MKPFPPITNLLPLSPRLSVLFTVSLFLGSTSATTRRQDAAPFTFHNTGSLATPRYGHTTTLLSNGMVLVAGGAHAGSVASAELYDASSGTWSGTSSLKTRRFLHTATLLPNGKVLIAGGFHDNSGSPIARAELYDPASGTWSATGNVTIPLTNVGNAQTIEVTIFGVSDGSTTCNVTIPLSVPVGDTNAIAFVNSSDIDIGQTVSGSNFRSDVTSNGVIDCSDATLVKTKVGSALP